MTHYQPHYPAFDVLREEEHWDPHTREIVLKRTATESFLPYRFLTPHAGDTLYRLCAILLDDDRAPILAYVVHHFDSTLTSGIGEAQRQAGVPRQSELIPQGLAWLDRICGERYGGPFLSLEQAVQREVVHRLMQGDSVLTAPDADVPVGSWSDKLLSQAVAAYYSHPAIWSEIGYAGPAYPRGYVRSELGLTDPWEARRDDN